MILFIESVNNVRKWYKIQDFEDLRPVFDLYPRTYDIAVESDTLQNALNDIAEYLSSHHMTAWIEGSDLSKSLREKALSLGLGLATAMAPTPTQSSIPSTPQTMQVENSPMDINGFGSHPRDSFLWTLRHIESNNGKNIKHKPVKVGLSAGDTAIGSWGLLPKTLREVANRFKLEGKTRPEIEKLAHMSNSTMEHHLLKNPKLELELARKLADHVFKRSKGNEHKAAYMWLNGHNLSPETISKDKLLNSSYVDKFKNIDIHNPLKEKKPTTPNFNFVFKSEVILHDQDFAEKVKSWHKKRADQITDNPVRSSNFVPDMGRIREAELDDVKPDSMLTSEEKLKRRLKDFNK